MATVALTSLSHGAGCGCKLPADELLSIVRDLPVSSDPRLLVGSATGDDAAVFAIRDDLALVQTVDFFTPIVDDPFDFGRIAAANALSDVYAMGGTPVTALNIVAFPLQRLGATVLTQVLEGGFAMTKSADCAIVGGHSIDDREPKYGLAVTGVVDPSSMLTVSAGEAGDLLVLTKPLGVGAISTANKRRRAAPSQIAEAVEVMTTLNAHASSRARAAGARAATDVTGFGLLGHLHNLALSSGLAAEVCAAKLPVLDGVLSLLEDGVGVSGGSRHNWRWAETFTTVDDGVADALVRLACDPTTSGGMLIAVSEGRSASIGGAIVGRLLDGEPGTVSLI